MSNMCTLTIFNCTLSHFILQPALCVNALEILQNCSLSLVSPPQTVLQYTVCRAFYKQSIVQSEARKLGADPTWFLCN